MTTTLEVPLEQEDTQHGRYLTFALDQEEFGIEIRHVTEIIGLQPVATLPEAPAYIRGIINLRGKIIPVIDMRTKLKKNAIEYTDRTCIIVLSIQGLSFGLIVDRVAEVMKIEDDQIVPPPNIHTGLQNSYLQGVGKANGHVKLLLDCERLFSEEETLVS